MTDPLSSAYASFMSALIGAYGDEQLLPLQVKSSVEGTGPLKESTTDEEIAIILSTL
jgi:hypothetical protein